MSKKELNVRKELLKEEMSKIHTTIKTSHTPNQLSSTINMVENFKSKYNNWSKREKRKYKEVYDDALKFAQFSLTKVALKLQGFEINGKH